MRAGMDDADYRRANHQLRDIARPLTQVRDAVALLDALQSIRKARDKPSSRRYADEVHRALHDGHRLQRERLSAQMLRDGGEKLRAVDLEINRTPTKDSDVATTRRGIKKTFRCGREAFSKTRKRARVTLLHEWRKQVKYLANEISLAEQLKLLKLKKARRRAEHLADVLGKDHDLAILRIKLRELSQGEIPEPSAERERLEHRIKRKRSKLQQKARRLGVQLYSAPVAKFHRLLKKQLKTSGHG
jgi:hypothetical protein